MNFSSVFGSPIKKFHQISRMDGLVSDSVFIAVESKEGFVWFGTEEGLQRFDGNDFRSYKEPINKVTEALNSGVRAIVVDKSDNLWISSENALIHYRQATEKFTIVDIKSHVIKQEKHKDQRLQIRSLYHTEKSLVWIGSYFGLTSYNEKTAEIRHYSLPPIRSIKEISENKFLLGTINNGLYVFSPINGTSKKLFNKDLKVVTAGAQEKPPYSIDLESLSKITITNIYIEDSDNILVSTWGLGLLRLNLKLDEVERIPLKGSPMYLQTLVKDQEKNFWLSANGGLYYGSKSVLNLELISDGTGTELDFADGFRNIFLSKKGKLIVSTYGFGVFVHDTTSKNFELLRVPQDNESYGDNDITALSFIPEKKLAIGSSNSKIWLYDTENKSFNFIQTPEIVTASGIGHINQVTQGELFVNMNWSSEAYTIKYNVKDYSVNSLEEFDQNEHVLIKMSETKSILSKNKGDDFLTLLSPRKGGTYKTIASSNIRIPKGINICGCYWISDTELVLAIKGMPILKIRIKNNILEIADTTKLRMLGNENRIFENDANQVLVVTLDQGIFKIPLDNFSRITKVNKSRVLSGIVSSQFDKSTNNLWLASTNGLLKFNINTQETVRFDEFDGLHDSEFNWSSTVDTDGFFYFGSRRGLVRFKPPKVQQAKKPLRVNLTGLTINNKPVSPDSNNFLSKSIVMIDSLALEHEQNNFAFEFSAPTLPREQKKLTYAYRLDDFESDWHYVDYKKRIASYTNIPHGDYIFRVKVQNKNGIWSEQDRTLAISISPPWWLTTWAYLAYILTVILVFYAAIQYRTKALTRRSKFLQKEVMARTKEVEQLLEKQNQEFANISHEFRTPLTLILGPISNVLKKLNPKTQSSEIKQLETTQRNSYRLLRMVDQLLNIESFQVKSIVQKQPISFGETTRLIADGFKELAKEKNCEFIVEDIVQINFEFTPDAYEKILLNLLSNAFKYTPTNGKISLKTSVHGSEFILTVSDTGIGIPVEEQANIFERFNRSTNVNQENAPGAGIGLSLVKNLVELHQGKIQLESQPQIGTTFTVTLPIVNPTNNAEFIYGIDDSLIDVELMTLAAQSPATSQVVSAAGDENTNRETILIIEDNDDMRHYIQESVSATYKVLTASDGEQGVSIAVQEIPDLIISDIMMPKLDGYQVTSQLRQHTATSHIPIILLTAKDDKVSRMKGWHERADEYLTKPFDVNELNIRIKSLLEIRDLLKQRFADSIFKTDAPSNSTDELENQEQIFIKNLNKVMEEFYTDHQIKISEISSKVAMSDRQLSRKLKSTVDMTPTEYLRKYRLERAKDLLSKGETVTNTAFQVGFTSSSYFTSCFKAHVGVKPSEFTSLKKA